MTQEGSTLTIFDSSRTWGVMCIHGQGPILTISQNHAVTTIHSTETFDGQNNARPDTWNGRRPPCATHGLHRNLHPPPSASQRATLPAGNQIAGSETRRRLNQQRGNRPPGPRCSRASICAGWAVAASHACCSQLPRFGAGVSDCLGAGWARGTTVVDMDAATGKSPVGKTGTLARGWIIRRTRWKKGKRSV